MHRRATAERRLASPAGSAVGERWRGAPLLPGPGESVLVAQSGFLGDVVLATPLLAALRRSLPGRRLVALVRPEAAGLLAGHPDLDAVEVDDKRGADRGPAGLVRVARRLRRHRFALAVTPHRSLRTALLLALTGVPRRAGFRDSAGSFLFHERVAAELRLHAAERNLQLLRPLGVEPEHCSPFPRLAVEPRAAVAAGRLLEQAGPKGAPLVGIAPGSAWATKRWTAEGFAAVASGLARDGARIVLLASQAEHELAAEVHRLAVRLGMAPGCAADLAGATDPATLVAVIDRLSLLVGNDSAPAHIAAARSVPVVAVFCATSPSQGFAPHGPRVELIGAELSCRPCSSHGSRRCPRGTEDCRHLVDPAEVLAAARRTLAAGWGAGQGAGRAGMERG